jgi:cytochrome c oxidase subunit 2
MFQEIFDVFLILGTLVGIVVIGYMLYNVYRYRDTGEPVDDETERPTLGEIPTGGGHGRKLFLSFSISAVIVLSLILWTYGALLIVENPSTAQAQPGEDIDTMTVDVTGYQFGWQFEYPNGETRDGTLRVPENTRVNLRVTSRDVFHNFGLPAFDTKTDAIPGQTTTTWFGPAEPGTYQAVCYELCGAGHSFMTAEVIVMEESAYDEWYANMTSNSTSSEVDA